MINRFSVLFKGGAIPKMKDGALGLQTMRAKSFMSCIKALSLLSIRPVSLNLNSKKSMLLFSPKPAKCTEIGGFVYDAALAVHRTRQGHVLG